MPKCILAEQGGKGGGGSSIVLTKIEVTTPPTKTSYLAGDSFQTAGMVITASYGMEGSAAVIATAEVSGYSVSPSTLTDGTTYVTISYSEQGVTCTTTQTVSVTHKLTKIAVTTNPTTTSYEYGATLSTAGMVVTATYSDGQTATVTGSCSPTALNTVTSSQAITVSYTENGVTCTTTFNVVVNRKSVPKPTWKNNLTYTGSSQSVNSSTYWNNYNTTYFTVSGTTSGTNAGTYTATFTPNSNYRWSDGTTTAINVDWVINKAAGSLSLSATEVAIDANNLTKTVTITRSGDGAISFTPTSVTGLTLSLSGNTLTITGDGSTKVTSTTITVKVAAGTNHNAPSNKTFTVSATYWEWGDETAVGDANWWAGLKSWAASATASERQAVVGKTKKVSLSTAILGGNAALMRCIGYDKDGANTLAFQTVGCFPTYTAFGSSAVWIGSTARSLCQNFYNYCSAKASIKTVSKGTCPSTNSSRAGTPTYNDETVFLLSEREFGLDSYAPISTANSTTTKAECTYGYNAAYDYYKDNASRIMYKMTANGDKQTSGDYGYPWERSRYYNGSSGVCYVNGSGSAGDYGYNGSCGLAPAFVIG